MKWTRTKNPLSWESGRLYFALAEASPFMEGGYIARIYATPAQMSLWGQSEAEPVAGTAKWGLDAEAALRQCIRRFDPEAKLPEREKVLP